MDGQARHSRTGQGPGLEGGVALALLQPPLPSGPSTLPSEPSRRGGSDRVSPKTSPGPLTYGLLVTVRDGVGERNGSEQGAGPGAH